MVVHQLNKANEFKLENIALTTKASRHDYEHQMPLLQKEALRIQRALFRHGERAMIIFEGCDAAGKGGMIRRYTAAMDPRNFSVHRIAAPRPDEQEKHYMFRFWNKLPAKGHVVIFDRSWYGRVLVERVEGLCPTERWQQAYQEINEFERQLTDDGIRIVKVYMQISAKEQLQRFKKRFENPYKRWKLTLEDFRNRAKWDSYKSATNDMLNKTSTTSAPWLVIGTDHKEAARLAAAQAINDKISADLNLDFPEPNQELKRVAETAFAEL